MSGLVKYNTGSITLPNGQLIQLSGLENEICSLLNTYNQLRSFKLTVVEILEWKDSILKVKPDIEVEAIRFVIDSMIVGDLDYDKDKGIQNIFIGLNKIEKHEDSYRIKPQRPW